MVTTLPYTLYINIISIDVITNAMYTIYYEIILRKIQQSSPYLYTLLYCAVFYLCIILLCLNIIYIHCFFTDQQKKKHIKGTTKEKILY